MELRGKLTDHDLRSAAWLHSAPRKFFAALGLLVLSLAVWALCLAFFGSKPDPGWGKWVLLAILVYLFAHYLVYVPFHLKREYRQYKALQKELLLSPDASGLTMTTENGKGIVPWSDVRSWKENKVLFMLYVTDRLYHLVPKRFFASAADIDDFRAMLQRLVRRK